MSNIISAPSAAQKSAGSTLIILLAAVCSLGPLATDMYLPALPEIVDSFASTPSVVQLTITSWLIGLSIGQILAGPLSDIYGRRMPLIIGLAVFAVSAAACIFVPTMTMFIFLRLVGGFAASSALVVSRAIASDIYRGAMLTKFLSTVMIIQGIAPIIAPVVGGQLLNFFPWESVFAVLTAAGILIFLLAMFKYTETLPSEKRLKADFAHVSKVFMSLCSRPYFASLCAIQFFIFCSLFAYISGMPFILQGIYGFSPQHFSFVFALVGVGMMFFGKLTNFLTGRIDDSQLLFYGLCQGVIFGILFLVGVILDLNIYLLIGFLLLSETSLAITASTSFSLAMQAQKRVAGSASALLGFFSNIAGAIVAPIVGIGGGMSALPTALVIACCEVFALIVFLFITKRSARAAADTAQVD